MLKTCKIVIIILLLPLLLTAQYKIEGTVTDAQTGEPLQAANVILKNSNKITTTDQNGFFTFYKLSKGAYNLKISFVGYKTYTKKIVVMKNIKLTLKLAPTVYMSDEVIISAIRADDNTPSTYVNISRNQLNRKNTGQDIPYLLKMTPSVVVSSDAGTGIGYTSLRIRGVDLTGINVTLNGVPVNDAESHGVYFVDLPDIASSTDNIQIQRGVGTSTNGAAAFGASINIKTDQFNRNPYAEINSSAGSFHSFKNTATFGTGLLNKHWLFIGRLSQIKSNGYIDRAFSNLRSAYLSSGYYGKNDVIKFIIMLGHERTYQAWYGVPKDSLKTNRTYNPAGKIIDANGNIIGYYKNQTDNYTQNYYQLHFAHKLNTKLNFATAAFLTRGYGYYESYKNNQNFLKYGLNDTIIGYDTVSNTNLIRQKWLNNYFYGFNMSVNYSGSIINATFGSAWNNYSGDHYGKIIWSQIARLDDYNRNWYFNTGLKSEFNIFGKINYRFTEHLNILVDIQYRNIYYRINGTHDDLRNLTQKHLFGFFNPKTGILYSINNHNQAYLSFAVSNREPNRSVYRDADTNQNIYSEHLNDYELGYKLLFNNFVFNATIYYMDYKNQFVLTGKINNVGTAILTNVPSSYRAGLEIATLINISPKLNWQFNATISQNKILNFSEYIDNWNYWDSPNIEPYQYKKYLGTTDISFSPTLLSSSNFTWSVFNNLQISWLSKYVGRQYIDNTSSLKRSLNPYWINNLVFNYSFYPKILKQINFILQLNNILNKQYETNAWIYRYIYNDKEHEIDGYYPQAGFNFIASLRLKF